MKPFSILCLLLLSGFAAAQTPAPQPAGQKTYTVQKGDTMYGIARRHGVSVADLMAANSMQSDAMQEGQQLIIPGVGGAAGNASVSFPEGTRVHVFLVPNGFPDPHFLGPAPDPFASTPQPPQATPSVAAKRHLESAGISLEEGKSVELMNGKLAVRCSEEEADRIEKLLDSLRSQAAREVMLRVEVFSATPAQYAAALAQNSGGGGLYQWCDAALENPESKVALEQFALLRVRSGQRSKVEQVDEYPYPTEFDPPQIAQTSGRTNATPVPVKDASTPAPAPAGTGVSHPPAYPLGMYVKDPRTQATPQGFETRSLGFGVEAEVTVGEDGLIADINLAPEFSKVIRVIPWQVDGEIYQPVFQTRKAAFQTMCELGKTRFAGTMSTPLDTGVAGADQDDRIWLVFITPSVAK